MNAEPNFPEDGLSLPGAFEHYMVGTNATFYLSPGKPVPLSKEWWAKHEELEEKAHVEFTAKLKSGTLAVRYGNGCKIPREAWCNHLPNHYLCSQIHDQGLVISVPPGDGLYPFNGVMPYITIGDFNAACHRDMTPSVLLGDSNSKPSTSTCSLVLRENRCTTWLAGLMRAGPPEHNKAKYFERARDKFPNLSKRGFLNRVWEDACKAVGPEVAKPWRTSGRRANS